MKIKCRLVKGLHTLLKILSRTCLLFCAGISCTLVLLYLYGPAAPGGLVCNFFVV